MATRSRNALGRALAWNARLVENALADLGLTTQQYLVMDLLAHLDRPASKLALGLRITRSSVTALVDRLVERGIVERSTDPEDRRRVLHALTDTGRNLLDEADAAVAEAFERWSQRLGVSPETTLGTWAAHAAAAIDDAVQAQLADHAQADP